MSDTAMKVGFACISGAYALINVANICWLVAAARARQRAEQQKDHFYDDIQIVVDLTALADLKPEQANQVLSNKKFKTPLTENIVETLPFFPDTEDKKTYLRRKTQKASYDDLKVIQKYFDEQKVPYKLVARQNPIRLSKYTRFERILPHQDLRRLKIAQMRIAIRTLA